MCNPFAHTLWRLLLFAWVLFTGCSHGDRPSLGYVTGTVTMDGKPLARVIVTFKPTEGRPSVGTTNDDGEYHLEYSYQVPGAKVGPNQVAFSWPIGVVGSHPIPARYGGRSELSCEVEAGENTFDFDLKSDPAASTPKRSRLPSD